MTKSLEQVANAMVAEGKGILAADESTGTIEKRFDQIDVESTEDTRRDYREMLFRSEEAMRNCISGVILFDETIRQRAKDGTALVDLISPAGKPHCENSEQRGKNPEIHGSRRIQGLENLPVDRLIGQGAHGSSSFFPILSASTTLAR